VSSIVSDDKHAASNALHERVRAFITHHEGDFDRLASDIAAFQAERIPAVANLWRADGLTRPERTEQLPAMPCDAFRMRRIAAHPSEDDARCFMTSGTTAGARGMHPMRTTETYELAALTWGERMLFRDRPRMPMIVLASPEVLAPESSLTFMLARFAGRLGGDASWHYDGRELDVKGIVARAQSATVPTLVAGTSFAFVHLLDTLGEARLPLPRGSRVMQTGGFKGRARVVEAAELRRLLARCFDVDEHDVVGEYGMTELSSQLYQRGERYHAPPWVRVTAVDPETLAPQPGRREGLARIVDLANVDSSVAIQTSDRVTVEEDGAVLLHGRMPGATPRGCSLALEHLLEPQ
jgi:hypothetical protein